MIQKEYTRFKGEGCYSINCGRVCRCQLGAANDITNVFTCRDLPIVGLPV